MRSAAADAAVRLLAALLLSPQVHQVRATRFTLPHTLCTTSSPLDTPHTMLLQSILSAPSQGHEVHPTPHTTLPSSILSAQPQVHQTQRYSHPYSVHNHKSIRHNVTPIHTQCITSSPSGTSHTSLPPSILCALPQIREAHSTRYNSRFKSSDILFL